MTPGSSSPYPASYSPMTPGGSAASPYPNTPGGMDTQAMNDWQTTEIEVRIRETSETPGLGGQIGTIQGVSVSNTNTFLSTIIYFFFRFRVGTVLYFCLKKNESSIFLLTIWNRWFLNLEIVSRCVIFILLLFLQSS